MEKQTDALVNNRSCSLLVLKNISISEIFGKLCSTVNKKTKKEIQKY